MQVHNSCFIDKKFTSPISSHANRASHGFVYFKSGQTNYTFINGKNVLASGGCFLYLPKYSTYSFKRITAGELYCINLDCNDDVFGEGAPDDKSFCFPLKRTNEIESIYKKVVREMFLKKPYFDLRIRGLIYELCSIIFSELDSEYIPTEKRSKLAPAVSFIDENYTSHNLKISYLASLCDMSENYFRRMFTATYGKSPVKYINERRINYASEFLRSGLYSVTEVASITGFDDIGYFSRVYKKISGELPSETALIN